MRTEDKIIHCFIICQASGALGVFLPSPTLNLASTVSSSFMFSVWQLSWDWRCRRLREASFAVISVIVRSGTIASVLYICVRARTVPPRVSKSDIALAASIWRTGTWFCVAVACSQRVWLAVMYVGMLGLIYSWIGARTIKPGVSECYILLAALIWRTRNWCLVAVAWIHSVWVVMINVCMLELMLVRVVLWRHGGHQGSFSR